MQDRHFFRCAPLGPHGPRPVVYRIYFCFYYWTDRFGERDEGFLSDWKGCVELTPCCSIAPLSFTCSASGLHIRGGFCCFIIIIGREAPPLLSSERAVFLSVSGQSVGVAAMILGGIWRTHLAYPYP